MNKIITLRMVVIAILLSGQIVLAQDGMPSFMRDSLDVYVKRAMKDWQIPGVAVCVVKDGKVVMTKTYGIRELGKPDKVDDNTLFYIGSNSKAFTATAISMLVQEKKIVLDEPIIKLWPDFKLHDPWVTKEVTTRDLLCHRIGFETFQGDFMFFNSDLTSAQILEKWAHVKPMYSFRSKWGYTNAAFLAAGELVHRVSGQPWSEFVTTKIFKPLEMNHTFALSQGLTEPNRAAAHTSVRGKLQKIPFGRIDGLGPAGSISSSISDMSHWITMQLDSGRYNGKQIVDSNVILRTREVSSVLGDGGPQFNHGHFYLYGLGWFLEEYEGRKVVAHTGGVNGFVTSVCLIPEERLGVVVLTNHDNNYFNEALRQEICDAYLKLPYRNYSAHYLNLGKERRDAAKKLFAARRDTIAHKPKTDLPLQAYTGTYVHAIAGRMIITLEKGKLMARFEHMKDNVATIEPLGASRFMTSFSEPIYGDDNIWPFAVADGKVRSVIVSVDGFVEFTTYEYVKGD